MRFAWMTAGMLMLGAIACSSSSKNTDTGSTEGAVQGGVTDQTHTFAVGVCNGPAPGRCQGICSGALILPNVIATARHCVSESPERIDCGENPTFGADRNSIYITTNTSMLSSATAGAGWYKAKSIHRPADNHVCGNDIALIIIDTMVPASVAKPIIPGIQHKMWDRAYYAPSFTAIGYGRTSPAGAGAGNGGAGTRRILESIDVRCVPGSNTMPCPPAFNEGEFVGGDGICQGDSGSSAYETTTLASGEPVSFGVLSRGGASDDGTECIGSLYSRFDAHRDFVLDVAVKASANWTLYDEPSWTGAADEPAGAKPKKPDAGAKPATGDEGSKGNAVIGEECKKNRDCASGVCVQTDDGNVCTTKCDDEENTCASGYACVEGLCLKAPETAPAPAAAAPGGAGAAPAATTQTVTKSACSFSPGQTGSGMDLGWLVGVGVAIAALRRRKA